jgi:L-alanine-DL-glutamate epimerase-like enolase superfamily enzyme
MKSFEQIAQAMYHAYRKRFGGKDTSGLDMATWDELGELSRQSWIAAARQATAELALVH